MEIRKKIAKKLMERSERRYEKSLNCFRDSASRILGNVKDARRVEKLVEDNSDLMNLRNIESILDTIENKNDVVFSGAKEIKDSLRESYINGLKQVYGNSYKRQLSKKYKELSKKYA